MPEIPIIRNSRELTTHLKKLNMTHNDFADLIGYSTAAFKKWRDENSTPQWVPYVIGYLQSLKEHEKIAIDLGISSCTKRKDTFK